MRTEWLILLMLSACRASPPPVHPVTAAKPTVTLCTLEVGPRRLMMMSMAAKSPGSTPQQQLESLVACTSLLLPAREAP